MTFEKILLESIDEGLDCLGKKAKQAIYFHLENKYSLNKEDIAHKVKIFTKAIEDVFQTGAILLEIKIMKILFSKIGQRNVPLDNPENLDFSSYINALKNMAYVSCYCYPVANNKELLCTCSFYH